MLGGGDEGLEDRAVHPRPPASDRCVVLRRLEGAAPSKGSTLFQSAAVLEMEKEMELELWRYGLLFRARAPYKSTV